MCIDEAQCGHLVLKKEDLLPRTLREPYRRAGMGAVMTLHTAAQSPFPEGGFAAPRPMMNDSPMALWPGRGDQGSLRGR